MAPPPGRTHHAQGQAVGAAHRPHVRRTSRLTGAHGAARADWPHHHFVPGASAGRGLISCQVDGGPVRSTGRTTTSGTGHGGSAAWHRHARGCKVTLGGVRQPPSRDAPRASSRSSSWANHSRGRAGVRRRPQTGPVHTATTARACQATCATSGAVPGRCRPLSRPAGAPAPGSGPLPPPAKRPGPRCNGRPSGRPDAAGQSGVVPVGRDSPARSDGLVCSSSAPSPSPGGPLASTGGHRRSRGRTRRARARPTTGRFWPTGRRGPRQGQRGPRAGPHPATHRAGGPGRRRRPRGGRSQARARPAHKRPRYARGHWPGN